MTGKGNMEYLAYLLVALIATLIGGITGLGGGLIIKPVLDFFGDYNVATINFLSSVTVFAMALFSLLRFQKQKIQPFSDNTLFLIIGSVLGGLIGLQIFNRLLMVINNDLVVIIQASGVIIILLIALFFHFTKKQFQLQKTR